jgi:DNA helicase IV
MTIVGDIAQATGPFAPDDWGQVLRHLPDRRPARVVELTVGYRIPERVMAVADRVLRSSLPGLRSPTSVRDGEFPPAVVSAPEGGLGATVAEAVRTEQARIGDGSVAVVAPGSMMDELGDALERAGVSFERAATRGLDDAVSLVPVSLVKGLEIDAVVVVEPGRMLREEPQPMRSLYVALTRSTKSITITHEEPLPAVLAG